MRRPRLRAMLSAYLALMLAYALANALQDAWTEQVVKRGWTHRTIPTCSIRRSASGGAGSSSSRPSSRSRPPAASAQAGAPLLIQKRFSAPCTLMNQTKAPTSGSRSQSPVMPVTGGCWPSRL